MFWRKRVVEEEVAPMADMSMVVDFEQEKLKAIINNGIDIYGDSSQFILYLLLNEKNEEYTQAILSLFVQNTRTQLENLKKDKPNDYKSMLEAYSYTKKKKKAY